MSALVRERRRPVPVPCAGAPRRRGHGFSLIEVLVAFVILALVATALFRLFGDSLGNAAAAEDWSRALLVAESQLDEAASAQPLREGGERGSDASGRVQWETRVAPYDAPDVDPDLERASEGLGTRMYRVTVDVRFTGTNGRERTFSLGTIRVGPRNPA
ncbi:MAG: prepilin-type N-terminal cleavage/methylation domain-containing protein [Burkholderiales bacterium]